MVGLGAGIRFNQAGASAKSTESQYQLVESSVDWNEYLHTHQPLVDKLGHSCCSSSSILSLELVSVL